LAALIADEQSGHCCLAIASVGRSDTAAAALA
jgi:hypothetical protein